MENVLYTKKVASANQCQDDCGIQYLVTKEVNCYLVWRSDNDSYKVVFNHYDKDYCIDKCRDLAIEEKYQRKSENKPTFKEIYE